MSQGILKYMSIENKMIRHLEKAHDLAKSNLDDSAYEIKKILKKKLKGGKR